MHDPVVAADGFSYERLALEKWFRSRASSPMTNLPLPTRLVFPNNSMRQAVGEWREQQRAAQKGAEQ